MDALGYTLVNTAIGQLGIAWGGRGLVGVQLPDRPRRRPARACRARFPGATEAPPPPAVRPAVDAIVALLRGEPADLSSVTLDMDGVPDFHRRVYQAARTIPTGTTASYGEIAARLGSPGAARAVGQALGRNPFAIVVPCHRVLAANGRVGGFSADGGIATKLRLLAIEAAAGASGAGGDRPAFDAEAAARHLRRDPALRRVIDRVGPLRLRVDRTSSLFLALAEAIVYQQLTGRAAATIFARVRALFPRAHQGFTPQQILRVSEERLRGAGLSRAKTLALKDLAGHARAGAIPTLEEAATLSDVELVNRLTGVRGIGPWTVEMLLIFRLGRPDVLPVDDYGVRKGFAVALGLPELPDRKALAARGERWRPYRSAASWYLWRAAEGA